jgi:hypothetical protein
MLKDALEAGVVEPVPFPEHQAILSSPVPHTPVMYVKHRSTVLLF